MRLFKRAWVLAAVLILNIALAVLLSPIGFESRPTVALKPAGYLAIGAVFAGLALDLAALVFLRKIVLASRFAIAGSILFLFPNVVDQTGVFFSVPIPPIVRVLEYIFIGVLLVTLLLAAAMQSNSDGPSG